MIREHFRGMSPVRQAAFFVIVLVAFFFALQYIDFLIEQGQAELTAAGIAFIACFGTGGAVLVLLLTLDREDRQVSLWEAGWDVFFSLSLGGLAAFLLILTFSLF